MAIEFHQDKGPHWAASFWNGVPQGDPGPLPGDSYEMVSFGNNIRDLGHGDVGSPWLLFKATRTYGFGYRSVGAYRGPTLPSMQLPVRVAVIPEAKHDRDYYSAGAKAIEATTPTNPTFDMATFIGESLTDGAPSMIGLETWRAKTLRAKQAGGEYLNYQFGWVPFVSDLRNFAYSVRNSSSIINNYRNNANKKIHRRFTISDTLDQDTYSFDDYIKTPWNDNIGRETCVATLSIRERMWFSGCYTYYMPVDNSMGSRITRYKEYANKLLGVRLTPEVVWNIAPWSWAVDWKTDIGSVIHNTSSIGHNGLVLQYGYVMHSLEHSQSSTSGSGTYSETFSRKRRVAANPYGFGVSSGGLSTQQVAILAALGLNRADSRIVS